MNHPTPWQVRYWQRFPEWDERSCPRIVDADGELVCAFPQSVFHPGAYDKLADETAKRIVEAMNGQAQLTRIIREQFNRGHLRKVQLFPCPKCNIRWTVDEWYSSKHPGMLNKLHAATEVGSIEEAEALYRAVFVALKPSYYDPKADAYSDYSDDCNFIVTGSHGLCSHCRFTTP